MANLIYTMITSLDGFICDENGNFDWAEPDEEVHRFANELDRRIGTHLYGRRMYETMVAWESPEMDSGPEVFAEYAAIWRAADKVVFSTTLDTVSSARTRIEHSFDPETIRELKASATKDIAISGAGLAAQALRAGLVDECGVLAVPKIAGAGTRMLPTGVSLDLELLDERRFANGTVYLQYRVKR